MPPGGIGDALVCTPAFRALKEHFPDEKIILYCYSKAHLQVFNDNPHIDSLRHLSIVSMIRYPFHLFGYLFKSKLISYTELHFQHVLLYPNIINKSVKEVVSDIFSISLTNKNIQVVVSKRENENAIRRLQPYKNVVLMHVHSRSSSNHHWPIENWIELVRQLPEYTFIQIGHKNENLVIGAIDWRSTTTLREAFALIKNANSFVGVDSSFSHATNAFSTPGVVLFGDSSPVHWGHDNNINIYKKTPCSPCYYYLWYHDCVYNHQCMNNISVEEVKQALVSQMSRSAAR